MDNNNNNNNPAPCGRVSRKMIMIHTQNKPIPSWLEIGNYTDLGSQERGGFSDSQDYPDMLIRYSRWHSVFSIGRSDTELRGLTELPESIATIHKALAEIAISRFRAFERSLSLPGSEPTPLGEICLRILWYPAQIVTVDRPHFDADFATVPLWDSEGPESLPFWGNLAPHINPNNVPLKHVFMANQKRDRVFVVAFLQAANYLDSVETGQSMDFEISRELERQGIDTKRKSV